MLPPDRWYQSEAVDSIAPFYGPNRSIVGNPLIGLPTGTGKARVNTRLVLQIMNHFPWDRGLCLTHSQQLVEQNALDLLEAAPFAPIGYCSAGMNKYDTVQPVIFGGIGTVIGRAEQFGFRNFVIVDEAHLISNSENTMYVKLFNKLKAINPNLIVIGLSATLYRMKMGSLLDNGLFTHVAYDLTSFEGFNKLLEQGFISPLIPQPTDNDFDVSKVKKSGGEFKQAELQAAVDTDEITEACCSEMVEKTWDRHCCIVFASGVEHADHIAQVLTGMGQTAASIHSKKKNNAEIMADFKAGRIRWLINYGKLTTGFNHPPVDFIGMMRPTMSPGLWVQMLGRGTRPYDGRLSYQYKPGFEYIKSNCLVLDFAGNAKRLGPINDPVLPRKPGEKGGDAPIKQCPAIVNGRKCNTYNHASARSCCLCGHLFPFTGAEIFINSGNTELIRKLEEKDIKWLDVGQVFYSVINKNNVPPMMRVKYTTGVKSVDEIVCLEHNTSAKHFAHNWWRQRYNGPIPPTTEAGLDIAHSGCLPIPKRVRVWINKKPYPEILDHEY